MYESGLTDYGFYQVKNTLQFVELNVKSCLDFIEKRIRVLSHQRNKRVCKTSAMKFNATALDKLYEN